MKANWNKTEAQYLIEKIAEVKLSVKIELEMLINNYTNKLNNMSWFTKFMYYNLSDDEYIKIIFVKDKLYRLTKLEEKVTRCFENGANSILLNNEELNDLF